MTCGIYCYKDTFNDNKIVYVGKDSSIDINKRHIAHNSPSNYDKQVINRVLQNNPNRYTYHILKKGDFDDKLLSALEIIYTRRYNPKFSFTIGGDGIRGFKHSDETKKKISDTNKRKFKGANNPMYNKHHSLKSREKMSKSHKGKVISVETRKKMSEANSGENHNLYRADIPNGHELYIMNKNGATYKELGKKYECHSTTIGCRIRKYKDEVGIL